MFRHKQKPVSKKISMASRIGLLAAVVVIAGMGVFSAAQPHKTAAESISSLQAKAKALQAQIAENNKHVAELQVQADSLQAKLGQLNTEIATVNAQIELTSVRISELEQQLKNAQDELERQKGLLKASMRALYKRGGASTVELLVGSDSFSQFIDDQEYLERLKIGIQDATQKVIDLKLQIQSQQEEQKNLLAAQQGQRDTLAAKQQEQQVLLNQTKGQQSQYKNAVAVLRQQQAEINAQLSVSGVVDYTSTTDYPWAHYEPWSFDGCSIDPWGMCVRQCVSYAAWKVAQSGRTMPNWGGYGNANQWDDNARAMGIPVNTSPRVGDVAISNAGFYGHAMYVEAVLSDGRIHVSQYNYELQGKYSEMTINPTGLVFIHFP